MNEILSKFESIIKDNTESNDTKLNKIFQETFF